MVIVRTATSKDFADCRHFEYDHTPDEWLKQAIRNGWVYVAVENDAITGYARLEFIWLHVPYLALISVDETHRRRGIGAAIIEHIAGDLTARDHRTLYSSSEAMAPAAQAFHRHCGFQECGIIAGMNEEGVGEVFFAKALEG